MPSRHSRQPNPSFDDLMAVARQAVASACDIKPEEVEIDEDGEIGFDQDGSAVVFVGAETDPPAFTFRSIILDDVQILPRTYELLNRINRDIKIGAFFCGDKSIYFYYHLLVDAPTSELVKYALCLSVQIADTYDDSLKTQLGGERFNEAPEDEIDV
ncbi:MAG: YbjN domain-containing protein [Synechococcaceae cyanobacterium]|nr:YbjN domain-containing protein [Synechococcaceae cyanobacterium]